MPAEQGKAKVWQFLRHSVIATATQRPLTLANHVQIGLPNNWYAKRLALSLESLAMYTDRKI